MKKVLKSRIFIFVLGLVIAGSIGVYAGSQILASDISYRNGTVETALNDLYDKANNQTMDGTVCMLLSGTKNTIGAKYVCNPGDGILRNFFILKVDGNNVKLIMEKNLSGEIGSVTMNYDSALHFFDEENDGYTVVSAWTNVQNVDLPSAQDIADAGEVVGWSIEDSGTYYFGGNTNTRGNYSWLYNYTRGCSNNLCTSGSDNYPDSNGYPYGYWTKDLVVGDSSIAWRVTRVGCLDFNTTTVLSHGVRPVITVAKNKLAG